MPIRTIDDKLNFTIWLNKQVKKAAISHKELLKEFCFSEGSGQIGHWTALSIGAQPTIPQWEQWLKLKKILQINDEMDAEVKRLNSEIGEAFHEREILDVGKSGITTYLHSKAQKSGSEKTIFSASFSNEARQWQGWNTQLKPAFQPIVFARKPISEKSVVENVLKHGTGAINEGACRIAVNPEADAIGKTTKRRTRDEAAVFDEDSCGYDNPNNPIGGVLPSGRYPANLILSHHPACKLIKEGSSEAWSRERNEGQSTGVYGIYGDRMRAPIEVEFKEVPELWGGVEGCPIRTLNEQSGGVGGGKATRGIRESTKNWRFQGSGEVIGHNDIGGAARFFFNCQMDWEREIVPFFYCAKPSVKERNAGLDQIYTFKPRNLHITVKPIALMRHLVRLVTRKGGLVLDPFLGSGSTAIAAQQEGMNWLGCDIDSEYCTIARARIKALGGALE